MFRFVELGTNEEQNLGIPVHNQNMPQIIFKLFVTCSNMQIRISPINVNKVCGVNTVMGLCNYE